MPDPLERVEKYLADRPRSRFGRIEFGLWIVGLAALTIVHAVQDGPNYRHGLSLICLGGATALLIRGRR